MILYNVSVIIDDSSHADLYQWLIDTLRDNPFGAKLLKMLDSPHEGTTYCIQIVAGDDAIAVFQQELLVHLQDYIIKHHAGKAFVFDSRMEYMALG